MNILVLYYYKPLKMLMQNKTFFKTVYPILILPISFIVFILMILDFFELHNLYVHAVVFLLFLLNFLIIYIILKVNESAYLAGQLNALSANEELNQKYYQMIDEKVAANNIQVHDIHKHMNVLHTYLQNKDYDKGIAYITTMQKNADKLKSHIYSGNKLLDVVMYSIQSNFDIRDIRIKYEKIEDFDYKSECLYDVNAIMYNMLDNAFESCSLLNGGTIYITFKREHTNYVIFKVVNSAISKKMDILETSKDDKDRHGIGVCSIKEAVERLGGSIAFSYDDHSHLFTTTAYIKYSNEKEAITYSRV